MRACLPFTRGVKDHPSSSHVGPSFVRACSEQIWGWVQQEWASAAEAAPQAQVEKESGRSQGLAESEALEGGVALHAGGAMQDSLTQVASVHHSGKRRDCRQVQ